MAAASDDQAGRKETVPGRVSWHGCGGEICSEVGVMALSEDEQRRLDEMETALRRDDPSFAASVSIDRVRRRRRIVAAVVSVLGIVVLVGGLVATAETVLAGVLISTVGLIMMVAVAVAVIRWRRHS